MFSHHDSIPDFLAIRPQRGAVSRGWGVLLLVERTVRGDARSTEERKNIILC